MRIQGSDSNILIFEHSNFPATSYDSASTLGFLRNNQVWKRLYEVSVSLQCFHASQRFQIAKVSLNNSVAV